MLWSVVHLSHRCPQCVHVTDTFMYRDIVTADLYTLLSNLYQNFDFFLNPDFLNIIIFIYIAVDWGKNVEK